MNLNYLITDRYHQDIFMPEGLQEKCKNLMKRKSPHRFTQHAKDHLSKLEDRSHRVDMYSLMDALKFLEEFPTDPFEVYTDKHKNPIKFCTRTDLTPNEDVVFVISDNKVVTFYVNDKNDEHDTLDYGLYSKK